jgi:hypothetical protein
MFDTITIKTNTPANPLDIGYLAECLLFYDHTKLFVDSNSIKELVISCGESEIQELIERGLLSIFTEGNILGGATHKDIYSVELLTPLSENLHLRAYDKVFNSIYDNQRGKARRHALKFASITNEYKFSQNIIDGIEKAIIDTKYIKQIINSFLLEIDLEKEYIGESWVYDFHQVDEHKFTHQTNLDLERLNTIATKKKLNFDFTPSTLLLFLANSFGDIQVACDYNSEICTTPVNSTIINQKFNKLFEDAKISREVINQFQRLALPRYRDLASVINSGEKTYRDLIDLIDKSERFKGWKQKIPNESDFIKEYFYALEKDSWIEGLPTKIGRIFIWGAISSLLAELVPQDINSVLGFGIFTSAFDMLLFDRLLKKWKPNQFINSDMRKFLN